MTAAAQTHKHTHKHGLAASVVPYARHAWSTARPRSRRGFRVPEQPEAIRLLCLRAGLDREEVEPARVRLGLLECLRLRRLQWRAHPR